ncbi:hypothetical protein BC829DRAFT_85415 [Chytridium lagenaria]|nr:hypothetical protein BC829DRAFT_85415 [Chytridium lagenaria]
MLFSHVCSVASIFGYINQNKYHIPNKTLTYTYANELTSLPNIARVFFNTKQTCKLVSTQQQQPNSSSNQTATATSSIFKRKPAATARLQHCNSFSQLQINRYIFAAHPQALQQPTNINSASEYLTVAFKANQRLQTSNSLASPTGPLCICELLFSCRLTGQPTGTT